jgi:hypothetical protein
VVLIDHSQMAKGFSGSLVVGVGEAIPSSFDAPGAHIGVQCASGHENHHITPKGASKFILPIKVLPWARNSDAFQAEQ